METHQSVVPTDNQLISDVLEGNQASFAELVDRYKQMAFNVAMKVLKEEEEAQDAAQDAFIKAYKHLSGFNGRSKFSTWFYRIVMNESLSRTRRKKYEKVSIEEAHNLGSEGQFSSENPKLVHLGLSQLAEKDALILTLFYLQELNLEEISEILEMTTNNVKVSVHRARQRLASKMLNLLGEEVYDLV